MNLRRIIRLLSKVFIISLITFVMLFAVIEISIANGILPDLRPIIPLVDDSILVHRVDLNYTDVDADGWRNRVVLEKADIVVIGDSQTYGISARRDDAYPQQLGQMMSVDVYNIAVGGYGPVQYSYLLDTVLEKQPSTIVIGLYLGNDVLDCHNILSLPYWQNHFSEEDIPLETVPYDPTSYVVSIDGEITGVRPFGEDFAVTEGRTLDEIQGTGSRIKDILNSSRTLGYIWYGLVRPIVIPQSDQFADIVTSTEKAENENGHLQATVAYQDDNIMITLTPYRRFIALNWEADAVQIGYDICNHMLDKIQQQCEINSVRCLFLIIPTKETVYDPYLTSQGFEPKGYYKLLIEMEDAMRERFLEFFDSIDAEVLDVTSEMQDAAIEQANKQQLLYPFHYDSHPNGVGYHVIASEIASYLSG